MVTMKNDGKAAVAKRVYGVDATAAFTYGALSENTDAEVATGTTLTGELTGGWARANMTASYVADYIGQLVHTWTSDATKAIRKFAIFNAASTGNMLLEHLWTGAKTTETGETLTVTYQGLVSQVT